MTGTTYQPESFELVFVDDDETAAEIGVAIEQSGGAALTLHGQFQRWAPDNSSADEATEWARGLVAEQTGVDADEVSATRSADWSRGDLRVGFREVGRSERAQAAPASYQVIVPNKMADYLVESAPLWGARFNTEPAGPHRTAVSFGADTWERLTALDSNTDGVIDGDTMWIGGEDWAVYER